MILKFVPNSAVARPIGTSRSLGNGLESNIQANLGCQRGFFTKVYDSLKSEHMLAIMRGNFHIRATSSMNRSLARGGDHDLVRLI